MTLFNSRAVQPQIDRRLRDQSHAAANRGRRSALPILVLVAMTICAWPGSRTFAADRPENDRSVIGSMARSSGTTDGPSVSPQKRTSSPSSSNADSLSDPRQSSGRCATLRERYAQSEACFARYRMKNRGLRPGAFQRCTQLKDPSTECGSLRREVADPPAGKCADRPRQGAGSEQQRQLGTGGVGRGLRRPGTGQARADISVSRSPFRIIQSVRPDDDQGDRSGEQQKSHAGRCRAMQGRFDSHTTLPSATAL
jgi:hypothetical protein